MREKPTHTSSLGLQLTSSSIKGAELILSKGNPKLKKIFEIKTTVEGEHVKPLYNDGQKQQFQSLLNKHLVATTLNTLDVLVRPLEVNLVKEKDIDAVLTFQAEPLFPYATEEALVDRFICEKNTESSELTVLSVRKDLLANHIEQWNSIDVEPEVVSCAPAALASFSKTFVETENKHIVCHIGQDETTCCLVRNGTLIFAQSFDKGLNFLMHETELNEDFNLESIDPKLLETLQHYRLEIVKIIFALQKQVNDETLDILFTGEGGSILSLVQFLNETLKKKVIDLKPSPLFPIDSEKLNKYALPIGVALSTLTGTKNQINFRQDDYAYPNPWKRIKTPILTYLGLTLLLSFAIYFFGTQYTENQKTELKQDYLNLLVLMKKPYETVESDVTGKNEESIQKPMTLSQPDILKRLNFLEKETKQTPDVHALLPNVPRVSDVLAWLSTHPNIALDNENDTNPKMKLESFNYKMVKYPQINKKKERYRVKVDLEFKTPLPRYAREFHDDLRVPNEIIDSKSEIKWNAEDGGRYKASFFLKDKTIYPR